MAIVADVSAYSDALVVLGTAGILVPVLSRFGVNPVIAYLGAGMLLGPFGLGSLVSSIPEIRWISVSDGKSVSFIAEFGIIFLMFLIGLEMTLERLLAMRRLMLGLGATQWLVTTAVIAALASLFGFGIASAITLGACLALSSTAMVVETLSRQGRLSTTTGRASFAILLAQDLLFIPLLLFIALLGKGNDSALVWTITLALLQAVLAIGLIFLLGRLILRPLFRLAASTQSTELFIAAILFVIVGTGVVAVQAGLSMVLGAFVAGLLLAETEYRKGIEAIVEPFKGLLLGVFFFTIGMLIDLKAVMQAPSLMILAIGGLLSVKVVILMIITRLNRVPWIASVETSLLLSPGGELAFVGISTATLAGALDKPTADFTIVVIALSMALIPLLAQVARWLLNRKHNPVVDPDLLVNPPQETGHAIVVGHGRVGQVICAMLDRHKVPYIATDTDARSVSLARKIGQRVYYGNATDSLFLKSCNIAEARAVIVTIHTPSMIERVVSAVRDLRADIPIIARARDALHASKLYQLGVNDAVPETIEASLQLSEAALVGLGVPMGYVIASIHEKRDEFRDIMQQAAKRAGQEQSHAIRKKGNGETDPNGQGVVPGDIAQR